MQAFIPEVIQKLVFWLRWLCSWHLSPWRRLSYLSKYAFAAANRTRYAGSGNRCQNHRFSAGKEFCNSLYIFGVLLLFSASLWGDSKKEIKSFVHSLSGEQSIILKEFFNALIKDSFSGYVLYGDKPMSIEGYPLEVEALSGIDEKALCILKGVEFWQALNISSEDKAYFFLILDAKNGYQHLICINRQAFLKVVNENLSLFRYALGPTLTADSLLQDLMKAKDQFYDVLKNDNVLLGVLLGYGTQNALLISREELISNAFASDRNEEFPFLSKMTRMHLLPSPKTLHPPSIGFNCLADEYQEIRKRVAVSRKLKPFNSYKLPHFGCEPSSQESKALLAMYEVNRKEIIKTVNANDFLEKTLLKLLTTSSGQLDLPPRPTTLPLSLPEDKEAIANRLVDIIHQEIKTEKYVHECLTKAFLQGACDEESGIYCPELSQEMHKRKWEIYVTEKDLERVDNLEKSKQYFHQLRTHKAIIALVDDKLYFKVLRQGKAAPATSKIKYATLHYSFHVLGESTSNVGTVKNENIKQFIPGVAHALTGMKRGEIKKLYIHPEYGYGEDSYLPPNLPIIATIELIDFKEEDDGESFALPCKIAERNREELLVKYEKLQKEQFYVNGANFWSFVKKNGELIDFKTFESYFTQKPENTRFHRKEISEDKHLSSNAKFLSDLQWRIMTCQKSG